MNAFLSILQEYIRLGIPDQIDYKKFYLYSLITHSTAIEGSTVTEIENQLLFDEGITAPGRTIAEQMMNLDLKRAYEQGQTWAEQHADYSVDMLCALSATLMQHTGSTYNTPLGSFSSAAGELRLLNVTAGYGGRSYMAFAKVPKALQEFCQWLNAERKKVSPSDIMAAYRLSFTAHYRLVTIHPWADGNGRMARLVMNMLQWEYNLIPVKVLNEQKAPYIQSLIDTREQEDESIFAKTMFAIHQQNLSAEIAAFNASMQGDEPQNEPQNEPQKFTQLSTRQQQIISLLRKDNSLSKQRLADALGLSMSTIKRELSAMSYVVKYVGPTKGGHWEIIEN
jgi:Fic family protein